MPQYSSLGTNAAGTKSLTVPAPSTQNQNTFIDGIYIIGENVSAAGNTYFRLTIPTQISEAGGTSHVFLTQSASGASACATGSWDFRNIGGLQIRNTNGTIAATFDCVPSGNAASMSAIITYHYA